MTDIARIVENRVVRYVRKVTIVPENETADTPTVAVYKFVLEAMRKQLFKQRVGTHFVVPLNGHRILRVGEDQLAAGLWMGTDGWMCNRWHPGPLFVIQPALKLLLRVISPGQKNTASPL